MPKSNKLNLNTLLEFYGFPIPAKRSVKLVFHSTPDYEFLDDYRWGKIRKIETYQREQGRHVFAECSNIVSFLSDGPSRAVFFGIYRIDAHQTLAKPPKEFSEELPTQSWIPGQSWYDMTHLDIMDELRGRLVVDWGKSARSWHQWLRPDQSKEIVEIRPVTLAKDFPGLDELRIEYAELKAVVADSDTYQIWHRNLESVGGVYLIVDMATGHQYVGSASGASGFLGRWRDYAQTGHGGNKELKNIKDFSGFQFSILYTCSTLKSPEEVRHYETLFKKKLGSRAHGLNRN